MEYYILHTPAVPWLILLPILSINNKLNVTNICNISKLMLFLILYGFSCTQLREIMRLNLNSTEESDIKEECLDGIKVIIYYITHNDCASLLNTGFENFNELHH